MTTRRSRPIRALAIDFRPFAILDFEFHPGVTAVYGLNGVGKSRLLHHLAHFDREKGPPAPNTLNPLDPDDPLHEYIWQSEDPPVGAKESEEFLHSLFFWAEEKFEIEITSDVLEELGKQKLYGWRGLGDSRARVGIAASLDPVDTPHLKGLVDGSVEALIEKLAESDDWLAEPRDEELDLASYSELVAGWNGADAEALALDALLQPTRYSDIRWWPISAIAGFVNMPELPLTKPHIVAEPIGDELRWTCPIQVFSEDSDLDVIDATSGYARAAVLDEARQRRSAGEIEIQDIDSSLESMDLQNAMHGYLKEVAERATQIYQQVFPTDEVLECLVDRPIDWLVKAPIEWIVQSAGWRWGSIDLMANAQQRWARFAIQLALEEAQRRRKGDDPVDIILIDEPESGMHMRGQRHLQNGLRLLAREYDCSIVVATHSPAFFRTPDVGLVHVQNYGEFSVARRMPGGLRRHVDELDLEPAEVLQTVKVFLVVEGLHDELLINGLLKDELEDLGACVYPIRGTSQLAATLDSQLLSDFTDAKVLIVLDNVRAEAVSERWKAARRLATEGDAAAAAELIEDWNATGSKEEEKLKSFLAELATHSRMSPQRFEVFGFAEPDILDYLDPVSITGETIDWADLRERSQVDSGTKFKRWLEKNYDADLSADGIEEAVKDLDRIPEEFTQLLAKIEQMLATSIDEGGSPRQSRPS